MFCGVFREMRREKGFLEAMRHLSWDVRLAAAEMAQRRRIVVPRNVFDELLRV